ncbi:MAG: hypothetical protein ACRCVN_03355 [Spirochaetia bacterium]
MVTVEQREIYQKQRDESAQKYDTLVEAESEQSIVVTSGTANLALATSALQCCGLQIRIGYLNETFLGGKRDESLLVARRDITRCLQYLEKAYTPYLDVPFSDYEKQLTELLAVDEFERYNLLKHVGFYITYLDDIFIEKSKWHWFFVEMEARLSVIFKNSLNLKNIIEQLDPRASRYPERTAVVNRVRDLLKKSAKEYRGRYELTSFARDDFNRAIEFLLAAKRLAVLLNNNQEADDLDREITVWKAKMEKDEQQRQKDDK